MKLGRNFTNTLIPEVISDENRKKIFSEETDLFSMNALGLMEFKKNVDLQLESSKKLGLDWLELDCDVPNPYLDFTDKQCKEILEKSKEFSIDLSVHLSYSGIGKEVSCIQEYERSMVSDLHRKYIDFAYKIGAKTCVLHPGTAPFYFLSPVFLKQIESALIKTLEELIPYAEERNIKFHIENNVSFDNIYWELDDILDIVDKVRQKGLTLYFNYDIGHWFTRSEKGKTIPDDFLNLMEKIPPQYVYELHLNDFIPKKVVFHPPLMDTGGLLKYEVLKSYFSILRDKLKPEVVVLETAFKTSQQLEKRWQLLEDETQYIRELMKNE